MFLQIEQGMNVVSKAFEFNFVVGLLSALLLGALGVIYFLYKEVKTTQSSKEQLVKESLGLITLVESQLADNKVANEIVTKSSSEVLTEIKLIKQLIEAFKK